MANKKSIEDLDDLELLNWILEHEFPWREELYRISDTRTLQGLVDFVRENFQTIKQIENEKTRINRKA
jgi:hypothetical protein